jgi:L-alanine-DL-glutamate epimerase-like enolase superfamily enzyme
VRIVEVETFHTENIAIVRVRTEDGHEGWGQVAPYHADITALVLHRQVAPHVLGQDDGDLTALGQRVLEAEQKFPGSHLVRALGGVDTALWDLRGRRAGRPVCELIGGSVRRIAVYASSMRRDIEPAREAARLAGLQDRYGYRAVKFRIGRELGHDQDQWPGRTQAVVPAVRTAVAEGTTLLVDANGCYTPAKAIEVGRMLQDEGVRHFEEPCPYWEQDWTAAVARSLDLQVAGGEQDCLLTTWRRMLELRAVDIAQPDVCYLGGLTRTLRVARLAAAAGLPVVPHAANLSLVTVFSLHLMAAIGNPGRYLEFSIEPDSYYPWQRELFDPALVVEDGTVAVPAGPGWGVDIRPGWLARAERRGSAL